MSVANYDNLRKYAPGLLGLAKKKDQTESEEEDEDISNIIEKKPRPSTVRKFFRKRVDRLNEENNNLDFL